MKAGIRTDDAVAWTSGELLQGGTDARFAGVAIDTRTLEGGELFVAIRGPTHDAHAFLERALEAGAKGLLVERGAALPTCPADLPVLAVDDTTRALGALAAGHRSRFEGPVIAITGSSGKTTTKEMCASILGAHTPCLKTRGNLNNHYGLPLTLLRIGSEHRRAVVELGMNHRGEIAALAAIARPSVGLVTNIGTAHIEFLGSREALAEEKGDLFAALGIEDTAVVNRDDPRVAEQATRAPGRVLGYGLENAAEVRAENVRFLEEGAFAFVLITPHGDKLPLRVSGIGDTTVINALAATAAALAAGASLDEVATGLSRYRPVGGRMTRRQLADGTTLIDDTYNANPQSMRASLESLKRLATAGRSLAVLGDMGELGETAGEAHRSTGRLVAELGIDFLYTLGSHARALAEGAREAGMRADRVREAGEPEELAASVREQLARGTRDWVLVKGSRAMRMERVVELLAAAERA